MKTVKAYSFIVSSFILGIMCAAAIVALVISFTAKDDLAAVESVFGTMVIVLCLLVFSLRSYKVGRSLLANAGDMDR